MELTINSSEFQTVAHELADTGKFLAYRGWSPATSSNFSARLSDNSMALTQSGTDKYDMSAENIIHVNMRGEVLAPKEAKPSAETAIHTTIYGERPDAQSVLHTHSVFGTRLSLKFESEGKLKVGGYELLKGLRGNSTHQTEEVLPVLSNSQDMKDFQRRVPELFHHYKNLHGFLIAGHGLYTWGATIQEAKRHVETFEFLFECLVYEQLGI